MRSSVRPVACRTAALTGLPRMEGPGPGVKPEEGALYVHISCVAARIDRAALIYTLSYGLRHSRVRGVAFPHRPPLRTLSANCGQGSVVPVGANRADRYGAEPVQGAADSAGRATGAVGRQPFVEVVRGLSSLGRGRGLRLVSSHVRVSRIRGRAQLGARAE